MSDEPQKPTIWIIYHRYSGGSGIPTLLRAYSSVTRAEADLAMMKRSPAMCFGEHYLVEVEYDDK